MGIPLNCAICNKEMIPLKLEDGTVKDYWLHCPKPFKELGLSAHFSHHNYYLTGGIHDLIIGQFKAGVFARTNCAFVYVNNLSTGRWDFLHQFLYKDIAQVATHLSRVEKLKAFL